VGRQVRLSGRVAFGAVMVITKWKRAMHGRQKTNVVTCQHKNIGLIESRPVFDSIPEHSEAYISIIREVFPASTNIYPAALN